MRAYIPNLYMAGHIGTNKNYIIITEYFSRTMTIQISYNIVGYD